MGHGVYHGTLFHNSLTFRWRYWVGAFRIFRSHPLLGVGFDNFASYYLGVRLPIAAEEVRDPHNFIVRFFVETGTIGGLFVLGWLLAVWWQLTRPITDEVPTTTPMPPRPLRWMMSIASLAIVVNIIASVDLAQNGWYVFNELLSACFTSGSTSSAAPSRASIERRSGAGQSAGGGAAGRHHRRDPLFFVHNLIDFSMFEAGPMFVMMMLIGAVIGIGAGCPPSIRSVGDHHAGGGDRCLAGGGAGCGGPDRPGRITGDHEGDDALRDHQPSLAAEKLRDAFDALWIPNADYCAVAARAMLYAGALPEQVQPMLDAAVAADPMNLNALRLRGEFPDEPAGSCVAKPGDKRFRAADVAQSKRRRCAH